MKIVVKNVKKIKYKNYFFIKVLNGLLFIIISSKSIYFLLIINKIINKV